MKDGYTFQNWTLDGEPYVFGTPVTQDITLVAEFEVAIPDVPSSLSDIKLMLNAGKTIPIGTEIPDTWGGTSNPIIIYHQFTTPNATYGGKAGVIIGRKYINTQRAFGGSAQYNSELDTNILPYLNSSYLNSCSSELKSLLSTFTVPYRTYNASTATSVEGKWHLMSGIEIGWAVNTQDLEGVMFDYWKQKTGLTSPNTSFAPYSGRIVTEPSGDASSWWLRTYSTSGTVLYMQASGAMVQYPSAISSSQGVLPIAFIAKD